jgi:hypothetical protein
MKKLFIVLIAAAFIVGSIMPAMAQPGPRYGAEGMQVSIRGEIGLDTKWSKVDSQRTQFPFGSNWDDTELTWDNNGSKVRIDFKKGPLSARFDVKGGNDDNLDKYYATWDFGAGRFILGKRDAPLFNPRHLPPPRKSGVGDGVAPGADGMVLILPFGPVTVSAAGYTPSTGRGTVVPTAVDKDSELPRFEAKVDFVIGPVACNIGGGMNSYSEVDANNKEYDIDSSMIQFNARYFGGPLMIMFDIWKDENGYGLTGGHPDSPVIPGPPGYVSGYNSVPYNAVTDTLGDFEITGWSVSVGYVLNDMVSIHVGYGEESLEQDTFGAAGDNEDDLQGYEIAVPIKITDFFSVTPYYIVEDYDTRTPAGGVAVDEGKAKAYGAYWNISW